MVFVISVAQHWLDWDTGQDGLIQGPIWWWGVQLKRDWSKDPSYDEEYSSRGIDPRTHLMMKSTAQEGLIQGPILRWGVQLKRNWSKDPSYDEEYSSRGIDPRTHLTMRSTAQEELIQGLILRWRVDPLSYVLIPVIHELHKSDTVVLNWPTSF